MESAPYTSTIVFLVRKGNPKNIKDWNDLVRDDVGVITPNPKTSGGARWNYLAAWYYFEKAGQSEEVRASIKKLYHNVVVLDSGARSATTSFVENGQGDVLLSWENEAFLSWENEAFLSLIENPGEYEIVIPSVSILCQPTVALVDEVVDYNETRDLAHSYLSYLYSKEAQRVEAKWYYRPSDKSVLDEFVYQGNERVIDKVPEDGRWIINSIDLTDIKHFGGWKATIAKHFANGAIFDSIYERK